jgi:putative oxidoreductase
MKNAIFKTNNDWTGLVLRLPNMIVTFHIPSILPRPGWLRGIPRWDILQKPCIFRGLLLVIVTEVITPIFLLVGLGSRIASCLLIALMVGIIYTTHFQFGFFMNWLGNQKGEGFEYHLLYIGLAIAVLFNGSGRYSMDGLFGKQIGGRVDYERGFLGRQAV